MGDGRKPTDEELVGEALLPMLEVVTQLDVAGAG